MKKQKILILSIAAVAGMVLTGCNLTPDASASDIPETSVIDDAVETSDEVGTKVALRAAVTPTAQVKVSDAFGYQVVDKTDSTMTIRLIAVVDDYKNLTAASVTSTVVSPRSEKGSATIGEDETVIKKEQTFPVDAVYSSLADDADVKWNGTVSDTDFAKKYYIIYTLKNIPAADYFDTIIVKFSATSLAEASQTFIVNANGIAGWDSKYTVKLNSGSTNTYALTGVTYNDGDDVEIPSEHYAVTDCYAVKDGTITVLGSGSYLFSSSKKVNKLILPDTITELKNYSLAVNAAEVYIPAKLSKATSSTFGNTSSKINFKFPKLVYGAESFVNSTQLYCAASEIVVKAGVKSIPNKFFSSSNTLAEGEKAIQYEGTEDEWAALKNDNNANSGFFKVDAWCSDSGKAKVTFHYGKGKIGDAIGDNVVETRTHHLLANPGSPISTEAGMEFKGWYTDETGTSAFDFSTTKILNDLELWAVYENASDGYSLDAPAQIDATGNSISATLKPGRETEYLKFTAPSDASADGDWYYFSLDSYVKDEINTKASSASKKIAVYDSAKTVVAPDNGFYVYNTGLVQYKKDSTDCVRIFAKPGETYYLGATLTSDSNATNGNYFYGDISISTFTYENDAKNEAITLTKGGDASSVNNFANYKNHFVYTKYVADASEVVLLKKSGTGSCTVQFYVYDETAKALQKFGDNNYTKLSSTSGQFSFDTVAGHTYYIQLEPTYFASGYTCSLSLESAPAGYSKSNAIAYTVGDTVTVANANGYDVFGTYYSFTTASDSSYTFSSTKGSSSYAQKFEIYDSTGESVKSKTSSRGSAITGEEFTLAAGSYTMLVSYSSSSVSAWTDFTFTMKEIQEGDSKSKPIAITPSIDGAATSLQSTATGHYYKVTATASNYMIIDLSTLPEGVTASLLTASGSKIYDSDCKFGGRIVYKTTSGASYILCLSGADSDVTLKFSREDNPEIGTKAETAYSMAFGDDGLFDLTSYNSSSTSSTQYFKFKVAKTSSYKLYFQTTKNGSGISMTSSTCSTSLSLYDSIDASSEMSALLKNDNDNGEHEETLGYNYSGYYEYALEAGKTYYAKVNLPGSNDNVDSWKLGLKEIQAGESVNSATDAGTISASDTSLTVTGNAGGYWNKVTFSDSKQISFTLPNDSTEVKIYKSSDTKTPVASLSGTTASEEIIVGAGTYYVRATVSGATEATSVSIALAQTDLPEYVRTNLGGPESAPTEDSTYVWKYDASSDMWTSGNKGASSTCSKLSYTFYCAGTLTFKYYASGENNRDYLNVIHNTETVVSKAGGDHKDVTDFSKVTDTDFTEVTIKIAFGDTIDFIFRKDSSVDKGLDSAYIKNLTFTKAA